MDKRQLLWAAAVCGSVLATTSGADAAILDTFSYSLHNHPDGNENPPPYGLRLDGIEHFVTGNGGNSATWTFDFTNMSATLVRRDGTDDDTLRVFGTAEGGLDGGTDYASGSPGQVEIDFTFTGFDAAADRSDPNIAISDLDPNPSDTGSGYIKFLEANQSIAKDTKVGLQAWKNGSDDVFFFADNEHRLNCPGDDACGFPVGNGWLSLVSVNGTDNGPFHPASQDWLFTATPVPAPATAWTLLVALVGLAGGMRACGRWRSPALGSSGHRS